MKLLLVMLCAIALAGCSQLTGVDGSPVTPGPVCVETENGRVCYLPNVPPTPPVPVVPAPQLAK